MRSFLRAEANRRMIDGDAYTAKSVMNAYMAIFGHLSKAVVILAATCRSQKFQKNNTKLNRIIIVQSLPNKLTSTWHGDEATVCPHVL